MGYTYTGDIFLSDICHARLPPFQAHGYNKSYIFLI